MYVKNNLIFVTLTFIFYLVLFSKCQEKEDNIIVYPKDLGIETYCHEDSYFIKIDVVFSKNLDKIIPFELELASPKYFTFKCILDGPMLNIFCFHSFINYIWSLEENSLMEIPYLFPYIKGIIWDYDSFIRKVYRYSWRTTEKCGFVSIFKTGDISLLQTNEQMIFEINEISGGKCYSSKYDYAFNMKLKLIDGDYFQELKNAKINHKNYTINFMNSFYLPILKGKKKEKGEIIFGKDYNYRYAICKYNNSINQNNFNNKYGFIFHCHIKINSYKIFKSPIKIKPFTDIIYIVKNDSDGKIINNFISVKFNIISSNNDRSNEIRNFKNIFSNIKNEPNFLILNSNMNSNIYICPDIPIFKIKNYNEGIKFGGINPFNSKFFFLLYGFLSNVQEYQNGVLNYLGKTKKEIKFNLEITDNIEINETKKSAICTIPSGTYINKDVLVEVNCICEHTSINDYNNIDLTLNYSLEKNNNFNNLLIIWPNDLTKKKNLFFYEIDALFVKKYDFGCYDKKFFFYLYVYDLKVQPEISFNLPLSYPKGLNAECKLHNSTIFICMIDLKFKRLIKGQNIVIFYDDYKYLKNDENNIVLYKVNTEKKNFKLNFQIAVENNCGDLNIIVVIKDTWFIFVNVIIPIIFYFFIVAIVFSFFFTAFIIIRIKIRNKKHKYYDDYDYGLENKQNPPDPKDPNTTIPQKTEMKKGSNEADIKKNK